MRPMTFINGVILGSSGALGCVLGIIVFFRWMLTRDASLDQNVVRSDLPLGDLLVYMCIFLAVGVLALAGFWGELRDKPWRGAADFALGVSVVAVLVYFFADPAARPRDFTLLGLAALLAAVLLTLARRTGLLPRWSRWLGE